jgi:hypothetical protein
MPKVMTDKAEAFADEASALGWKTELTRKGDKATVVAVLDDKELSIAWRGSACLNEVTFTEDGHTRKLRNAAAARRKLAEEAEETPAAKGKQSAQSMKPKPPKTKKKKEPKPKPEPFKSTPKPRTSMPFDPETASDEEILKAVQGRKITWYNRISRGYDSARVMNQPNQKQLKIQINQRNERCLTWCAVEDNVPLGEDYRGPFRSVRISAITSVTK